MPNKAISSSQHFPLLLSVYLGFFFTNTQDSQDISLIILFHFHPLHRHLDLSRAIIAESSTLHIAGLEQGTVGFQAQIANH